MTTQKIIDNIQTRLENLISERFSGSYQQIDISCSNYNPTIDSNITITITITDESGTPITGFTVPLKIDGTSITGITTNSSGVATHTYNCTEWGTHKISVKSVSAFINVTGWKTFFNDANCTGYYNDDLVMLDIHINSTSIPKNWAEFSADIIPINPDLRPYYGVTSSSINSPRDFVRVLSNSQKVGRATVADSAKTNVPLYTELIWKRK